MIFWYDTKLQATKEKKADTLDIIKIKTNCASENAI